MFDWTNLETALRSNIDVGFLTKRSI